MPATVLLTDMLETAWADSPPPPTAATGSAADRMAPAVTVTACSGVAQIVETVLRSRAPAVAVVDEYGRILGAIDPEDYPDLFGDTDVRVAGTARQRRRRDRRATATAQDLMGPADTVPTTSPAARAPRAPFVFVVDELGRVAGVLLEARPGARAA